MDGSCVAEISREIGKHGVEDRRFDGSGGVVIEINARHGKFQWSATMKATGNSLQRNEGKRASGRRASIEIEKRGNLPGQLNPVGTADCGIPLVLVPGG